MPEIKHNFTGGKMNKDLDERLVPNGEYRDAMNIQVSTSESSDVGTVQNILGNSLIAHKHDFIGETAVCVGSIADEKNDKLYYFITQKELVINGGFDTNSDWELGSGWTISNSKAVASGDSGNLYQTETQFTNGKTYIVKYTISDYTKGNLRVILYDNDNNYALGTTKSSNGEYVDYITINNTGGSHDNRIFFQTHNTSDEDFKLDNISIKEAGDIIIEYDSTTNAITPVLVDLTGDVLKFSSDRLITGVNIIDDMLLWTDNHSEPKKINISRCIEGTDPVGLTHTKLINKSRGYDIYSNIDLQEEHITVIRKSPKTAPTIELSSGQIAGQTYGGIMRITPDPGGLTAGGANPQNSSSFINPSNQYYDFSQFSLGSQFSTRIETDLQGNSGFALSWNVNDTVVLKEFGGANYDEVPSSPITNYSIKAKVIDVIQPQDDIAELTSNGDFTLPNINGSKPLGYSWTSGDITYVSSEVVSGILQPPKIVYSGTGNYEKVKGTVSPAFVVGDVSLGQVAGVYKVRVEIANLTAGSKAGITFVETVGAQQVYWTFPGGLLNGVNEATITLDTNTGIATNGFASYSGKFFIQSGQNANDSHDFEILNVSIERQDVTDAQVKLEITGFEGTPPATPPNYTELKYAVEKLNEEEKLFEYKFPRFAYRYQYEDKEYSTFSPFTQVAFLPGSFDYHPRNAYNLGMVNNVNEIKLSGFIPTTVLNGESQDVVAVDILYKDEASSNVYVVDTIKNNQHNSDIWIKDEYVVKSEIIKRVLPSNQLLRPWDAVPKTALAQEVSGNRIVYANYTQGFNLIKPDTNQEYYTDLNVGFSSEYQGLSTVKSIKSLREYQLGVVFVDKYGRETPVLSNSTGGKKIAKKDSNKRNQIEVSFSSAVFPEDLEYFKFFIKETSGEYYNMSMDRWWDAGDGLAWLSFPSSDINKIDIDTFLILKKGVGSNNLVEDKARYKVLAIETEAPDFIKTNKILLEEKTQIFTSTDDSLFGNTVNNAPLLGRDSFDMNFLPFADSAGSTLQHIKEQEGILYIEFAIGDGTSDRYRITEISQPQATPPKYHIKLNKKLGDDVNFICDDPLGPTKIVDNTVVRIYKYLPENTSEFDGRFFVKVNKDDVFNTNVYSETIGSTSYRVSVTKKLYYMGSNQNKLHSSELTNQTIGIYQNPIYPVTSGATSSNLGGPNNNLHFGSFASFFRNYKWESVTVQNPNGSDIGQYRFDDTNQTDWEGELNWTGQGQNSNWQSSFPDLKAADHSGFDDGERYGVFNNKEEQEKGNVWFIDGGPYSGERTDADSLDWSFIHMTNSNEQGLVQGNQSSSMIIAMGGIYHDKENHEQDMQNDSHKTAEFFNIGRDNGNPYYNSTQFKDLVGKISPSVKFRFREDPTGEIYTIQPSGVNFHRRLRWSDGAKQAPSSGEFPAWTGTDRPQAAQLSPNFSMGYKTTFKNSNETGAINWDPTGGGVTGPITNGLKLTVTYGSTATVLNFNQLFVSNIHDITCSVNGGKHSITIGMILTKYGAISLGGSFNDPNGNTNNSFSMEPLIVSDIDDVSGGFILTLTGYSSPLFTSDSITSGATALGLLTHKITDASPSTGNDLVFQQPAMNGYSQYSVNRINVELPGGLADPALLAVGYTIEFLEELETESEFPSNPAVWETEPKETTDLDIYYEASGYNPLELTEGTKYLAIPATSLVECVERPAATLVNMTVNSVDYAPLPSTLAVGQSGTGPWRLSLATKFTQDEPLVGADYIQIGRHLKITKPDGSIITVEVTGWDASAGFTSYPTRTPFIYIKELLYGPDTTYTLGWHNCYSFGNGVESNRIRDTYNLPFIANGVKASTTLDENPYEEQLKYGLIYSGIYNSNSSINNLNQFIAAEKITKEINPTYGSIQKLKAGWGQGGDLITLCEDRVLKILANKDALFNADGNANLTSTNNVLGQAIPYSGEYGISKNPESFASEAYRAYFTDKVRGAVMRLSMDGLTPISNAGMKDWFRDNLKLSNKLIGSYDDRQDEYNISLQATNENSLPLILTARTVSYKESVKGWVSFKSFVPENALSTANNYYTVFGGKLYKHHVEDVDRNTFYDTFTNSSLNVLLNDMPSSIKSYHTLEYEGSQSRVVENLEDNEYYNLTDKDGWHVSSIETNKKKGSLLEFIEKEGKWFNYIKGVESDINKTTDFASFDIQGLGIIQSIDNNNITIDGDLNVSLQIEDTIYFNSTQIEAVGSTQIETVGEVTAINDNTITVDNSGTLPSQGDYIFFVKNQVVNMSNLSGYYADAKFENNSKVKAELYAVSSEVTESSK